MDNLKKRLDDLETIENNIKLLNDLLSQYSTHSSTEDDKQLVKVSSVPFHTSIDPPTRSLSHTLSH